jgi:glycosyltransferase involved in cell wall biosynthesis
MRLLLERIAAGLGRGSDVAIYHEFHRPPYGGGNQFLLALRGELGRRGYRVAANRIDTTTRACLFNSFNFDLEHLRGSRRDGCRMVHRVDGPVGSYRGEDDAIDRRIRDMNVELAEATVFQSRYSLEAHRAMGLELVAPVVITNAVDPRIFFPPPRPRAIGARVRVISTSWSSNPNKGAATYVWLDEHLDHDRYEYTFVGRVGARLRHIRVIPPLPSGRLAGMLREHDVYITASLRDPCSNALLEALACGLPAIYADSGGHPEIVGEAGSAFRSPEEIPDLLDALVRDHAERRAAIRIPSLTEVADRYLEALGITRRSG